jgi:hypothetical protein
MTNQEFLKNKSSKELEALAKLAAALATALKTEQPSYSLAIAAGIKDKSYDTASNGSIGSYSGEAIITMENGKTWKCVGHSSSGNAYYANNGYIEFIPIDSPFVVVYHSCYDDGVGSPFRVYPSADSYLTQHPSMYQHEGTYESEDAANKAAKDMWSALLEERAFSGTLD